MNQITKNKAASSRFRRPVTANMFKNIILLIFVYLPTTSFGKHFMVATKEIALKRDDKSPVS